MNIHVTIIEDEERFAQDLTKKKKKTGFMPIIWKLR